MSKLTAQSQTTTPSTTAIAHILLVEDNIVNQRVATRMIERLGHRVEVITNGREAVEAIASEAYDLALMDCQMPIMDGYEATRAIRQRETQTGQHLPIIALTANAMHGDREKCLEAGMDDYVSKPVDQAILQELLQKWLPASPRSATERLAPNDASSASASPGLVGIDHEAYDALLALCDVNETPEILCDILETFLQDTRAQLDALQQAAETIDAAQLEAAAHALKASSSNVAALGMAKLCTVLQMIGRAGSVNGATSYIQQLNNEFSCVQDVFINECARWRRVHSQFS